MEENETLTVFDDVYPDEYSVSSVVQLKDNSSFYSYQPFMSKGLISSVTNISLLIQEVDISDMLRNSHCSEWGKIQHIYYQSFHLLVLLALLLPSSPSLAALPFRAFIVSGSCGLLFYGVQISCSLDTVFWSILYIAVNTVWLIITLVKNRPTRLDSIYLESYNSLFRPLKLSKEQFKMLLDESRGVERLMPKQQYVEEKITRVDSLTLVLSGRLCVSQQGSPLHSVAGSQFLESPEWFGVTNDHYFQVSVMAVEESEVVVWHRDKLKFFLANHPDIEAIFDHVLGRDVVRKLIEGQGIQEDKSFVVKKKSNHFLSSFLVDKSNMKLGKISENEDESLV